MARLENKVAIITGGGDGIGQATCKLFVQEGAKVAIFEIVEEKGRATVEQLRAAGADCFFAKVNVAEESEVVTGVAQVLNRWGTIDVLVNAAAILGADKYAHELSVEEWDRTFAVNVRGSFLCVKHVLTTMMQAKRGSIVNFSSVYGLVGSLDVPSYHATKGAVVAMTKTDAICYGPYGIRVNVVHPGAVKTKMMLASGDTYPGGREAHLAMMQRLHVLPLPEPIDIAYCVLFLASDEARNVTGSSLICDGGYTAQ